jgi:hypothetical protein
MMSCVVFQDVARASVSEGRVKHTVPERACACGGTCAKTKTAEEFAHRKQLSVTVNLEQGVAGSGTTPSVGLIFASAMRWPSLESHEGIETLCSRRSVSGGKRVRQTLTMVHTWRDSSEMQDARVFFEDSS